MGINKLRWMRYTQGAVSGTNLPHGEYAALKRGVGAERAAHVRGFEDDAIRDEEGRSKQGELF